MGAESFLVRLRGQQPNLQEVLAYAQRELGVIPDPEQYALSDDYTYYVFRDGRHVIEFEFFQARDSYDISIRFAVCHPPSVDLVFIGHVLALLREFDLTATICEELPEGEPREYRADDSEQFTANCSWSITRTRDSWRAMCGSEERGVPVADAWRPLLRANADQ